MNLWIFLAVAAGICTTLQSSANGALSKAMSTPAAVTINTIVFTLCFLTYLIFSAKQGELNLHRWQESHWTSMLGGLFGFGIVFFLTMCFPKLGALLTVVLVVIGQAVAALIVDHFGIYGMPQNSITLARVAGVAMMIGGFLLLKK